LNDATGGERRGESDPGHCRFFFETRQKVGTGAIRKKREKPLSKYFSGHCITNNDFLEQRAQHEHSHIKKEWKEIVKRKATSPENIEEALGSGSKNRRIRRNGQMIECLLFYVPLKNISLIWRRHHYQ
jgi:hypothetical protein